ncbi:hypothetical protein F2Q70_00009775 [Brassica cretica]|uniref:Replication factor A C-terminal domain-containing protein n=1 Tax=Brassica cretica TaxID=69181 RepID=A0A8S9LU20_BRACR|nr:hypothetical protein F2Q70_00009775 [Brassica cretica]
MVISRVFFSDLKSSKCSSVVEAWLLRFWEARNVKRGGELMCVDMLLMDVNRLAARTIYSVSGFDVARCAQNFKLADSSLMIRFSDSTEFDVLADPISPLPAEGSGSILHGEIKVVKSTVSGPPEDKNRVMVTVKLENDVSVTLSLFDAQAVLFHQKLEGMRGDPKVIVATSINPKMVVDSLCVYYDKEINAGESFFYRLVARDTGLPAAEPLLRSYAKVEPVTIAELNNFITTAPSQEIDFLCTGRVSRVEADKGWCYVACSKCRTFVCFDGVMTKLHNLRASEAVQLLAEERVNPEDFVMPPFVAEMEGKTYTFQVRVTSYNFTVNHQTFTVSRIINEGGDDDDDDDAPDGTTSREKSASGKGGCETSKSAGKEPVGNVRKRARVD